MFYEIKKLEGELKVFKGGKLSKIEDLAETLLDHTGEPHKDTEVRLVTIIETITEFGNCIPEGESLKIIDC